MADIQNATILNIETGGCMESKFRLSICWLAHGCMPRVQYRQFTTACVAGGWC